MHFLFVFLLQELAAHLAAADFGAFLASLQGLLSRRVNKLLVGFHGGEPEAVLVGEVVAGALGPVALDEWRRAEVLQAGAGRHQGLAATLSASCRVLKRRDGQISFLVSFKKSQTNQTWKQKRAIYGQSQKPIIKINESKTEKNSGSTYWCRAVLLP